MDIIAEDQGFMVSTMLISNIPTPARNPRSPILTGEIRNEPVRAARARNSGLTAFACMLLGPQWPYRFTRQATTTARDPGMRSQLADALAHGPL
jgi:hypothetical protein